jgi:hypothetical protein
MANISASPEQRSCQADHAKPRRDFFLQGFVPLALLTWTVTSSLSVYPHSLSYFNELAGGPKCGPRHLLNSNIDWGQDLFYVGKWRRRQNRDDATAMHIAFDNYYNPLDIEPSFGAWPFKRDDTRNVPSVPEGDYAISVNLLYGYPWSVRAQDGRRYYIDQRPLGHLRDMQSIGDAGYSIRVYSAEQLRTAYFLASQEGER